MGASLLLSGALIGYLAARERVAPPAPPTESAAIVGNLPPFTVAAESPLNIEVLAFENRTFFATASSVAEARGSDLVRSDVPILRGLPDFVEISAVSGRFPENAYVAVGTPDGCFLRITVYHWRGQQWESLRAGDPNELLHGLCSWGDRVVALYASSTRGAYFEDLAGGQPPVLSTEPLAARPRGCTDNAGTAEAPRVHGTESSDHSLRQRRLMRGTGHGTSWSEPHRRHGCSFRMRDKGRRNFTSCCSAGASTSPSCTCTVRSWCPIWRAGGVNGCRSYRKQRPSSSSRTESARSCLRRPMPSTG